MDSWKNQIKNAQSVSECDAIENSLNGLLKRAKARKAVLQKEIDEKELNFQGRDAAACSEGCGNTVDPRNEEYCAKCQECEAILCKQCQASCKDCEGIVCFEHGKYCEFCDETVCRECDCTVRCSRCGEEICRDCVHLVGPPRWEYCKKCRDDWVSDGWRKY